MIVLDEPTTGLDVITQATILEEVRRLQRELGVALVYVTHDMAAVASVVDRIAVMYAGDIIEEGDVTGVVTRPLHPYSRGLVSSVPDPRKARRTADRDPGGRRRAGGGGRCLRLRTALRSQDSRVRGGAASAARRRQRSQRPLHPLGADAGAILRAPRCRR